MGASGDTVVNSTDVNATKVKYNELWKLKKKKWMKSNLESQEKLT